MTISAGQSTISAAAENSSRQRNELALEAAAELELERRDCERSLLCFFAAAWEHVDSTPLSLNWHVAAICKHLQAVFDGEISTLVINVPPGCGKSLICNVIWPVWGWIKNPSLRWFFASYAEKLSVRDAVKMRRLIQSPWFQARWGDRIEFEGDQNTKLRYDTTAGGWRIATSVGGLGTGEHPDYVVIDDPHNATEAMSDAERQQAVDWYDATISTRGVARGVRRVIIMQRLHETDLSGHILEKKPEGLVHLCIPMKFEGNKTPNAFGFTDPRVTEGDLMFPSLFSDKIVSELEKSLGSYGAAGQLQQRPAPAEGGIFKRAWIRRYEIEGDLLKCEGHGSFRLAECWMFGVMDLAISQKQSADYTALGVFAVTPKGGMCLIDLFRDRIQGPDMPPLVKRTQERWKLNYTIIEAVQFQESLVQQCRRMMLPIKGVRPKGDKVSRAHAAAVRFEAELVFLPKSADWLGILENEMFSFPNAAHDDTVDVISYGCEEVTRYFGSKEAA